MVYRAQLRWPAVGGHPTPAPAVAGGGLPAAWIAGPEAPARADVNPPGRRPGAVISAARDPAGQGCGAAATRTTRGRSRLPPRRQVRWCTRSAGLSIGSGLALWPECSPPGRNARAGPMATRARASTVPGAQGGIRRGVKAYPPVARGGSGVVSSPRLPRAGDGVASRRRWAPEFARTLEGWRGSAELLPGAVRRMHSYLSASGQKARGALVECHAAD